MSLARTLRRISLRWRMRRAATAWVCSLAVAGSLAWALGQPSYLLAAFLLTVVAAAWPVDLACIAQALDDANQQAGRLVAAHELALLPTRTPFMEAAIRDADSRALPQPLPRPQLGWVYALAALELIALFVPSAQPQRAGLRAEPEATASPIRSERVSSAQERARALAALDALEAHVIAREAARLRSLEALRPVLKGAGGEPTSEALRELADGVVGPRLSGTARARLQEALERAREHERARLAEAQRDAVQREQERKLEQLTRPQSDERKLEQLTRPQSDERELERPTRPQNEQKPSGGGQTASRAQDRELESQLGSAAQALQQGRDSEASEALRKGAEALARQRQQARQQRQQLGQLREQLQRPTGDPQRREQFEQAARGGGSERDRGEHTPAERRIGGSYQDERLRGAHGEGPSRSQVIEGASQAGFASAPYRRVYADYRAHAEQLLERDDVPAGERFYVRRYFDLVQPRDAR
jgi:hypothetical protein